MSFCTFSISCPNSNLVQNFGKIALNDFYFTNFSYGFVCYLNFMSFLSVSIVVVGANFCIPIIRITGCEVDAFSGD
jgi:hypothetical protein